MNKLNTKSITLGSGILAIFAFVLMTLPTIASAQNSNYNYTFSTYQPPIYTARAVNNPSPSIRSINPSSSNIGLGAKNVTIVGSDFVPSSVARINGSNRPTTFIDSSHLLVQVTGNDTYTYRNDGGFFITVFNGAPGGGHSNAAFFAVNNTVAENEEIEGSITGGSDFMDVNGEEQNVSNLAANAIFGSNGILPSGLIQWILFAILILIVVILIRRIHGADKRYEEKPLKHA